MSAVTQRATLDDLYRTPGKAELIGGRIVELMATGIRPNEVAANIYVGLRGHAAQTKRGKAFTDNMGFAVPTLPSGRESFSPEASYYEGPLPANLMRFVQGPPNFGAEVRSEYDYGPTAEAQLAIKRDEYFLAGTQLFGMSIRKPKRSIVTGRPRHGSPSSSGAATWPMPNPLYRDGGFGSMMSSREETA